MSRTTSRLLRAAGGDAGGQRVRSLHRDRRVDDRERRVHHLRSHRLHPHAPDPAPTGLGHHPGARQRPDTGQRPGDPGAGCGLRRRAERLAGRLLLQRPDHRGAADGRAQGPDGPSPARRQVRGAVGPGPAPPDADGGGGNPGVLSVDSARRLTDRYAEVLPPDSIRKYRDVILGLNLADDYGCADCWGGRAIRQSEIAQWADYARTRLPGLALGVRVEPQWVASYPALGPEIDYAWAQYHTRKGEPKAYYAAAAATAQKLGLEVVMGVNVEHCYGPNTDACSPADLQRFGTLAVTHPASCGFISWKYEPARWEDPAVRAVWDGLFAVARGRGEWGAGGGVEARMSPVDNTVYDRMADSWWDENGFLHTLAALNPARFGYMRRVLVEELRLTPVGLRALDIGCGGGLLAEEFARLGCVVMGMDPSVESLAAARAHAASRRLAIGYQCAAGEALPFVDESFDIVYCCDVLEHVIDWRQVIAETARVLKPGGTYLYDTINRTHRSRLVVIKLLQEWPWTALMPPSVHDWHMFIRPTELRQALEHHGLVPGGMTGLKPRANPLRLVGTLRRHKRGLLSYAAAVREMDLGESPDTSVSYIGYARKPGTKA